MTVFNLNRAGFDADEAEDSVAARAPIHCSESRFSAWPAKGCALAGPVFTTFTVRLAERALALLAGAARLVYIEAVIWQGAAIMLSRLGVVAALFGLGMVSSSAVFAGQLASRCASAADGFLSSLEKEQRDQAAWPFAGDKRRKWTYYPNVPQLDVRTEGLAIKDMSAEQRIAAHRLIECGLSSQGYQKSAGIMRLDDILGQTDLYRPRRPEDVAPVGSGNYWLAVFGDPGDMDPWGWQLEGHHLGLNFTVVDGEIIFAPAFMGADPAEVPDGPYAGWRLLGDEVDKAFALVNALNAEQLERAVVAGEIPERLITGPGRTAALKEFTGLPAAELDGEQLALLGDLIEEYVRNSSEPIALSHIAQIMEHVPDATWFTWMGPTTPGSGIYYRVHSPVLLIEFVTARNRQSEEREPNPNHVHSIFRYPGNDFGEDLLRRHYESSPDHQDE